MPRGLRLLGDRLIIEIPRIKAKLTEPPRTIIHGDYRLDNCFFPANATARPLVVFDWEFCARGKGVCDVAAFVSEAFPPQQRRHGEMGLLRTYHSALVSNGVSGYPLRRVPVRLPAFYAGSAWSFGSSREATAISMVNVRQRICATQWSASTPPFPISHALSCFQDSVMDGAPLQTAAPETTQT